MKCKGKVIEKNNLGKKKILPCDTKLAAHQIFCHKCGTPTDALSTGLSFKQNRQQAWQKFRENKSRYYRFAIFMIIVVFAWIMASVVFGTKNFWYNNLALLFIVPLSLIPFSFAPDFSGKPFTVGMFIKHLKFYPRYWLFTLLAILWFIFLKILCTGAFLNIATDPILHEVRLILVLYSIVIAMPIPIMMIRMNLNPIKAAIIAYKAGKETRWQQFFLLVYLFIINLIGLAALGLGLLITIPFSYVLIERYYLKMEEYELFETEGRGYYVQEKN
jgi:hypothetical protein